MHVLHQTSIGKLEDVSNSNLFTLTYHIWLYTKLHLEMQKSPLSCVTVDVMLTVPTCMAQPSLWKGGWRLMAPLVTNSGLKMAKLSQQSMPSCSRSRTSSTYRSGNFGLLIISLGIIGPHSLEIKDAQTLITQLNPLRARNYKYCMCQCQWCTYTLRRP